MYSRLMACAFFLTAFLMNHVHAGEPRNGSCYDSNQAAFYIQTFNIQTAKFRHADDLCSPKNELLSFFAALDFIAGLQFNQQVTRPVMPGLVSYDYFLFLRENIKSVVKESHSEADGGMDPKTGELALGAGFIKNSNLIERAGVLVHEARHHTKTNNGYEHVKCRGGEFRGVYACDPSFRTGGAYAVEVEFLARIFYSAIGIDAELKTAARTTAVHTLDGNFLNPEVSFED